MLVGEQYVDSSKIFSVSSSGEFRKSGIDDEDSLSGSVALNVGDEMYLKLPDDSGNGEELENKGEVTIGGEDMETSDGPTKFMVEIGCSGDCGELGVDVPVND